MAELSVVDRCKLAAGLIEQTPPGEVNDVVNDIRALIADDAALMPHILPSLRAYNLAQLQVVEHAVTEDAPAHTSLLSPAAVLPGSEEERYVDAEGKRSFKFDHAALAASAYEPYELPEEEQTFRAEVAKSLSAYTKNHFPAGHCSVTCSQHPLLPPASAALAIDPNPGHTEPEAPVVTVTDVVPDPVPAGDHEPDPTPAADGAAKTGTEELDKPGGLEKVDEMVHEVKIEEDSEAAQAGMEVEAAQAGEGMSGELTVEESKPEEEPIIETAAVSEPQTAPTADRPVVEERKQERVENPLYTIEIVGNRYNPSNFWTGRWRTHWVVDKATGKVDGNIDVDVHYYEQGNVQLATKHHASFPCPAQASGSQSIASQIVTTISKVEAAYQSDLNDVYGELGDKAFRALRRALPVTRQKMEWEKVSGYSLGSDLTKARA